MKPEERLNLLINRLYDGKKVEFAKQVDISPQALNNWFKRGLSREAINKIGERLKNININWLLTGEGEMFLQQSPTGNVELISSSKGNGEIVSVRFFSVSPTATFQEFCAGMEEDQDFININTLPEEVVNDTYCVFEIHGDSMAPQIQNKARVLCYEISPTRWHMLQETIVVIAYSNRFVIKRIIKNYLDSQNYLILASDNPDYKGTECVALDDIRCIYKAERIISQKIH